jgi:hypothetical protein
MFQSAPGKGQGALETDRDKNAERSKYRGGAMQFLKTMG